MASFLAFVNMYVGQFSDPPCFVEKAAVHQRGKVDLALVQHLVGEIVRKVFHPGRIILILRALLFVLFPLLHSQAFTKDLRNQTIPVASYSTVRSETFRLQTGDTFSVTAESDDARFAIDLYVYDINHVLVGKSDDESSSTLFNWVAPMEGEYFLLAQNISHSSGFMTITVVQGKGQIQSIAPTFAIVKVFYATDRNSLGNSNVSQQYGTEPDPSELLHFGECSVSIPRDHRMGELEGPSIFRLEFRKNAEKYITLLSVNEEGQSFFFRKISDRINHSRSREMFVFIHGFNCTFEDSVRRTAQIAYDLAFDGPAIVYSWPSQGRISLTAYNMDGTNAELTVPRLVCFLKDLVTQSGATTIHLIAHSMGNRPLTSALKQLASMGTAKDIPHFNQIVLMAPDINVSIFKMLAQEIRPCSKRITLYASSRDEALKISSSLAGYPRAGQGGSSIIVVPGVDTIDASSVDTSSLGLFHQYYADNSTVLSDLFHVLRDEPPDNRFGLKKDVTAIGVHWEFRISR
jgi:esterase/lipase superfamily enzyme